MLEAARHVLSELERVETEVRRLSGNTDGTIRACTQCNTGYHWLGPLLSVYQRKHPGVTINIAADATDRPVAALLDGHVDLAILVRAVTDPRLRLRPLFTDEMVAIVASTSPLARRQWISAEDLAAQHLLLYSSAPDESFVFRELLTPAGLVPARVSFIMLTEAMIELARAGAGVGVLPRWSAQRAIATGAVAGLSLTRRGLRRQWAAATLAAQPDPLFMTDFIDLVAERALPARAAVRDTA